MFIKKILASILVLILALDPGVSYAQGFVMANLPEPGQMVTGSPAFVPVLVKGLIIHPDQPLNFDFLVDSGNDSTDQALIKTESERMVRYFLAALTVPADQLWVNLSPYEKDRMIADDLGATDLGRDMLAQDYVLKQLTASLIYPEKELGKEFWARVYKEAQEKLGTTDIPMDTFNKVWIVPAEAEVFEKGNAVYVTGAKLKVMLDSDYIAASKDPGQSTQNASESQELAKQVVREVILPAIEREVNTGKNFAPLRQIYHAAILAKWYREAVVNTLVDKVYVGKNKITGVDVADKTVKERIYQRYIAAYKKGVFNYIKEEANSLTGETVPRKYFSGGISDFAMKDVPFVRTSSAAVKTIGEAFNVSFALRKPDAAMSGDVEKLLPRATEDLNRLGINDQRAKEFFATALDSSNKQNSAGASLSIQQFAQRISRIQPRLPDKVLEGAIRKLAEEIHYDGEKTVKLITDALQEVVPVPVRSEVTGAGSYWASESDIAGLKARLGRLAGIADSKIREQEVLTEAERLWGVHETKSTYAYGPFIAAYVELASGTLEGFQKMRQALINQNFESKESLKSLIDSLSAVPLSEEQKLQILVGEMMKPDVDAPLFAVTAVQKMTPATDIERDIQATVNKIFETFPADYKNKVGFKSSLARALGFVLREGRDFQVYLSDNKVGVELVPITKNPRPWKTYKELLAGLSDQAMADLAMSAVLLANVPDPAALLAFLQSSDQQQLPISIVLLGTSVTLVTAMAYISNLWKRNRIRSSLEKLSDEGTPLESRVASAAYLTDVLASDKKRFLATRNGREKDEYEREIRNILWNLYLTGVNDPDYKVLRECIYGLAYFMEIDVVRDWLRQIAERYKTAKVGINLQDASLKLRLLADLERDLALLEREWPRGTTPDNAMGFLNASVAMNPGSTDLAMLDPDSLTAVRWLPVGTLALMISYYFMAGSGDGAVLLRVERQGKTVVMGKRGFLERESNFYYLFNYAVELLNSMAQGEEVLAEHQVIQEALKQWKEGKEIVLAASLVKHVDGLVGVEIIKTADPAMKPGGIDINNIDVSKQNAGAGIRFDDRAVEEILQGGFDGFAPVIINITPVANPLLLLGMRQEEATFAEI
jgi:hypothetical protein